MSNRRRALLVANSDYGDPALSSLSSPVQDVKELARVLENEKIGGFEVETLTNEKAAIIVQAIEDLFDLSDPKPDDLLLLYFSGHGVTDEEGQLYLAATDTRIVRGKVRQFSAVGARFVNEKMQTSRSRRQVLILDCCHSGAFSDGMRMKGAMLQGLDTRFQEKNNQGKGRMVLTASTGTQYSFEGGS
jgi:uncharacterized caspase-like protein